MAGVEFDGVATREVFDNTSAGLRMGVPNPYGTPLPSGPQNAGNVLQSVQHRTNDLYAQARAQSAPMQEPATPLMGYNPSTMDVITGSGIFNLGNLTESAAAIQNGAFASAPEKLPDGFQRIKTTEILGYIDRTAQARGVGSAVKEVGRNLVTGTVSGIPDMLGKAAQFASPEDSLVHRAGAGLRDAAKWTEGKLGGAPDTFGRGGVSTAFIEAGSNLPASAAGMAAAAVNPWVGVPAIIALFGGSQAQDTYEAALKKGLDKGTAMEAALQTGGIEGAGEAVADVVLGRVLPGGMKMLKSLTAAGKMSTEEAVRIATDPKMLGNFAKSMAAAYGTEGATEFGQGYGEAAVEKAYGIRNEDPMQAGLHGAGVAAAMTTMLGPFAAVRQSAAAKDRAALGAALNDPARPVDMLQAAQVIRREIAPMTGEAAANDWMNARNEIGLQGILKEDTDKYLGDFMGRVNAAPQDTLPGVSPITSLYQNAFPSGTNLNLFGFQPEAPGPVSDENLPPLNPTQVPADFVTAMRQYDLTLPMPATEAEQKQRQATAEALGQQVAAQGFGTVQHESQGELPLEQTRNKAGWRGSARIAFSEAGGTGKKIEQALSLGSPEQAAQKLRYLAEVAKSTKQAEAFDAAHKSLLGVSIEEFPNTNRLQNVREQLLGALLPKQKDELARILGIGQYEKQPSDVTIAATAGVTNSAVGKWYNSIADRLKPVVERLGITRKEAEQALGIDRTVTTDATEEQLAELTNSGSISEDGEAAEVAQNQLHTNATLGVKQGTAVGKAMYKRVAGENGRAWDELSTLEQTHAADAARSVKENAQGAEGEGTGVVASPSVRKAHARAQGVAAIEAIAQNPVGELKPEPPTPIKDANALTDFVETNQDLMENPENTLLERVAEKLSHVKVPDRMDLGTELDLSIEEWDAVGVPGDPAWNELTIDEQVAWVTNFVRWKLDQAALETHQFKANLVENRDGQERSKPAAQEGAGKADARKAPPAKGVQGEAAGSEKEKPGEYAVAAPLVRPEREAGPVTVTKGKKAQKLANKKKVQYREGEAAQHATDAVAMRNLLLKLFFSPEKFDSLVKIVQSARDLKPAEYALLRGADPDSISGISTGGRIILIADNIVEGQELAVFLHEVGVHLGMEKLLGKANMEKLAAQVEAWAKAGTGLEGSIAKEAVRRAEKTTSDNKREELIAYFIDEAVKAGVNPTALKNQSNALTQWFRTLWAAAKVTLRKISFGRFDQLTAQNLVDLAFGSAKLELTGTWHGTAAKFRNFNHNYMGTGEANAAVGERTTNVGAFGWGTYLAQLVGVAKGYWEADVARKTKLPGTENDYFHHDLWKYLQDGKVIRNVDTSIGYVRYDGADPEVKRAFRLVVQHGGVAEALRKYQERSKAEVDEDVVSVLEDWSDSGAQLEDAPKAPEGALMRVDVAVHDDEMLDWGKPLSEQSEVVQKAMKHVLAKIAETDKSAARNADAWGITPAEWLTRQEKDSTGKQLYSMLEKSFGSDKAASEYLDSIGIKGIKFLDSQSRTARKNTDLIKQLEDLKAKAEASISTYRAQMSNASEYSRPGFARLIKMQEAEIANLDRKIAEENVEPEKTRNLVIFNDKNIQRVSTQVGASRESDKINYAEVDTADEFVPKDTVKGRFTNILGHLRRAGVSLRELAQIKREFGSDLTRTKDGKEEGLGPLEELIRLSGSYSKEVLDMARGTIDKVVALDETARNKLSHLLNQASLNGFVLSEPDTSARNGWMLSDLKDAEGEALDEAKAVHDRFKALRAEYNAAGKEVSDLYAAVDALTERLLQLEFGTRTKFIIDSYLTELKAKVDGETKAEIEKISFDDLTPATFTAQRNKLKALFKGNAEAEKAIRDMSAEVHTRMEGFHQRRGTYVPLMRFGDWVVVARSNDFVEQQKVVDASKAELDALKRKSPEMVEYMKLADAAAEARASAHKRGSKVSYEAAAEARKAMKEFRNTKEFKDFKEELGKVAREYKKEYRTLVRMAKDSKHFNVHKEEREDFAKQRADNYVANGFSKENVYHKPADTWIGGIDSVSTSFANKLIDRINRSYEGDSDHDKAMRKRNEQAVKRIFVETQHENSSLHRLAMRRSISGYNKDISRVLQSFMLQSAHRLSAQKFFIPIQEQLDAVREIASDKDKAGSTKLTEVANELAIRRHMDLSYEETPIQDAVTRFNQAWVLGASPAYLMQQFGQTFMLTVPHLSGRNSVGAATKAMWKGVRDAVSLIRESGKGSGLMNRFEIKLDSKLLTEDEQKALKYVADLGQLDILMDHDISLGARGKETSKYDRMIEMTNWTARQLETTNRIATALAAYRLESARLKKEGKLTAEQVHDEAKKYAAEITDLSQVDYSNENAARWMKRNAFAGSKIVMQFKKYAVHMMQSLTWQLHQATKGLTKEERTEARRILSGIFTTHMLMAGSLGLPIAAPIFAVAQMVAWIWPDDDEPDPEVAYKNFLADMIGKDAADAFVRGLPAALGADMSKRLGLGNVFSPVPFVRSDKQGKEQFDAMVLAYLGPSMSTGGRLVDGMSALTDGKFVDAWSKMLPKYIADPLKAYKAAQEGITTKQGNVRIPADNLSVADVIMIGMGVPSLKVNKYYEYNTAFEDQKAAATRVASELKKQWAKGDDRPGTREAIDEFNERHPSMRITPKDLFAAQKETVRYAKGVTEDGLKVGKRDKEFAENLRF